MAKHINQKAMDFNAYIRDVKDFPKPGITFKDITPLLQDAVAIEMASQALYGFVGNQLIDKVVGVDSRGFIFAPLLATKLNAGFVPVRKKGKLPSERLTESYDLEYGTDSLEIHTDSIKKGERVLVHDDVLATGGTAGAVCKLIERLGGEVVQCNFIIHLGFLKGEEKLNGYPIKSLLTY
jgi:adenine phosphoribosyltransferase